MEHGVGPMGRAQTLLTARLAHALFPVCPWGGLAQPSAAQGRVIPSPSTPCLTPVRLRNPPGGKDNILQRERLKKSDLPTNFCFWFWGGLAPSWGPLNTPCRPQVAHLWACLRGHGVTTYSHLMP